MIVNDKDKSRVENVERIIEKESHDFCKVYYHNKDVEDMFKELVGKVCWTEMHDRNLIFIDPYGYKNIRKEVLVDLMNNRKTEIILFLPISHMQRFTKVALEDKENKSQYEPLRQFINSFFSEEHEIRTGNLDAMEFINCIKEVLKFNGAYYTTSYYTP